MTVIAAVITRYCTAQASDSLITKLQQDGTRVPKEWERTKIVAVPHWRGVMAYWGLAVYDAYQWSTLDWLQERAQETNQYTSSEDFARAMTEMLNEAISKMTFHRSLDAGIGIHFTAYEYINNYWIPELFLLSNFEDPSYRSLHSDGVHLSRETYHHIDRNVRGPQPEHRETTYRLKVHKHLQAGGMLIYNNGDPLLFNPAASAIFAIIQELVRRGKLGNPASTATYRAIVRRPIEIVSRMQLDFARQETRTIGGKPHDLAVTPNGEYSSDSGDA
jgi:hypothetical protein